MLLRTLIAARQPSLRKKVARSIAAAEAVVTEVDSRRELWKQLKRGPHDLVLLERALLGDSTELIDGIRSSPEPPEVIVLAEGEDPERRAVLLAAGCLAVISGGLGEELLTEVLGALAARRRSDAEIALRPVPDERHRLADYVSKSRSMEQFLAMAHRVADRDSTLLILGETGVGKGLLARSIHNEGRRADHAFVSINCGALTESLLESELFGHEQGAFTGATRSRRGYFELAHRGTVFLDEIAELPFHLQAKLLKVLEDKKVQPLGSEREIRVDVRIITASNREIESEVKERRFRSDLYYRLNVFALLLPPLRHRKEDIPGLAQSYLEHFRTRIDTQVVGIQPNAVSALCEYSWPGNVRELINVIERAVLLCTDDLIGLDDLPDEIAAVGARSSSPATRPECPSHSAWLDLPWVDARRQVVEEAERQYLEHHLREARGRVGEVAKRAGIDPRSLYEKMKRGGLRKESFRGPRDRLRPT